MAAVAFYGFNGERLRILEEPIDDETLREDVVYLGNRRFGLSVGGRAEKMEVGVNDGDHEIKQNLFEGDAWKLMQMNLYGNTFYVMRNIKGAGEKLYVPAVATAFMIATAVLLLSNNNNLEQVVGYQIAAGLIGIGVVTLLRGISFRAFPKELK